MAKWYDEYLTDQEKKHLQVGQKGIRARQRKQTHEQNVKTAQANTLERERKGGEAYANKMQSDWNRSRNTIKKAFTENHVAQAVANKPQPVKNYSRSSQRMQSVSQSPTGQKQIRDMQFAVNKDTLKTGKKQMSNKKR
jgi:hypothetical protein